MQCSAILCGIDIENLFDKESFLCSFAGEQQDDEPPPEPAPPEIPPRAQSLLVTLKKASTHTIKVDDTGDLKHEEFIPQSQQRGKLSATPLIERYTREYSQYFGWNLLRAIHMVIKAAVSGVKICDATTWASNSTRSQYMHAMHELST